MGAALYFDESEEKITTVAAGMSLPAMPPQTRGK